MNAHEILSAADAFVRHFRRREADDLDAAWADWIRFRRLSDEDAVRIRREADLVLNTKPQPPLAA
jgi:hypothetical protein